MDRHRTDLVSLFFGLAFAVAGVAVLADGLVLTPRQIGAVWPALLVLLGIWVLAATVQRWGSREAEADPDTD